jgi:hypothetical protein
VPHCASLRLTSDLVIFSDMQVIPAPYRAQKMLLPYRIRLLVYGLCRERRMVSSNSGTYLGRLLIAPTMPFLVLETLVIEIKSIWELSTQNASR